MSDAADFRRLVLAYYHQLRKGGLTKAGARELVGALVNTADAIDLFHIHRDLETLAALRRAVGSVGTCLASQDDVQRIKARRGLPYILKAEDAVVGYVYEKARRVAYELTR
jgi:hypothetical protein